MLVERLGLALVPVIGALYPLLRAFPAARGWYMRRRVALLYGELKLVELAIDGAAAAPRDDLLARLDQLRRAREGVSCSASGFPER